MIETTRERRPGPTQEVTPPGGGRRTARAGRAGDVVLNALFLLPAGVYVVLFFAFPLVRNVVMAMQSYTTRTFYTGEAPWVGAANYVSVVGSTLFGDLVVHTAVFTVASIAGQFVLGLALAVFFARRFPLNRLLRSLLLLPWLLPLVVSGTVFRWMFDVDNGVFNALLGLVGLPGVPWLASTDTALLTVVLVNIWVGIPFNLVILYGGLKEVPQEYHEAAQLDGANRLQAFWYVVLPQLRAVVAVVLVLGFVYTVKVLDLVLVLTRGGPANATQTLATQAYKLSFETFEFGQGAALGNVLIGVTLVLALCYLWLNRRAAAAAA